MKKLLIYIVILGSLGLIFSSCQSAPGQVQAQAVASTTTAATSAPASSSTSATTTAVNYTGKFSLSPTHGRIGDTVNAAGSGFASDATLDLVWQTVKGTWQTADGNFNGRDFTNISIPLTEVKTDGSGSFQTSFTVPDGFGFSHNVIVENQNAVQNQSNFNVDMQVSISPASGPVGTPINFDIKGDGWQAMVNSWMVIYDNKFTGWISSVTTNGKASFSIPAAGLPGTHVIQILHGSATFPYLNMQQSPQPNRPSWSFEFTVTDGDPVLPAPATGQNWPAQPGTGKPSTDGPAIWTDNSLGTVGSPITLTGNGLPAEKQLDVVWFTVQGSRVSGNGWVDVPNKIGQVTTASDGTFTYSFNTPDDLGGSHRIEVQSSGTKVAETTFIITPSAFAISPASGPDGATFTIHLKGVSWTETANNYYLVYDNGYEGYVCGFNSQGDVTVHIPATGGPGWHFIDLYPGIYKGTDMSGTDNFRIPQLTALQDHPNEHLPVFHFAFQVTGQ